MDDNKILRYAAIIYFFVTIPSIFVSAFCLMKVWNWYIPLYFNIRELDMIIALGLGFVSCFFRYSAEASHDVEVEDYIKSIIKNSILSYIKPVFIMVIAFIVKIIFL